MYNLRIRDLREDLDMTQTEIANILNTNQKVYSRYETGVNEIPIRHLITLAIFYDVSLDYICGLTTQKNHQRRNNAERKRANNGNHDQERQASI